MEIKIGWKQYGAKSNGINSPRRRIYLILYFTMEQSKYHNSVTKYWEQHIGKFMHNHSSIDHTFVIEIFL